MSRKVARHLFYFRPGEESRMLARCQFGVDDERGCGATFTYPIKGYPWRRNVMRSHVFDLTPETRELLFDEVHRIRAQFPSECLSNTELYSDTSEKANGITRDRLTHTLCHTIAILLKNHEPEDYYAMRESSPALLNSDLYRIISDLIAPYERL